MKNRTNIIHLLALAAIAFVVVTSLSVPNVFAGIAHNMIDTVGVGGD